MIARFRTRCRRCLRWIEPGERITKDGGDYVHDDECDDHEDPPEDRWDGQ